MTQAAAIYKLQQDDYYYPTRLAQNETLIRLQREITHSPKNENFSDLEVKLSYLVISKPNENEATQKYHDLIKILGKDQQGLNFYSKRILLCNRQMSENEIKHFVETAFMDVHKNFYFVLDSHILTPQNFTILIQELQNYHQKILKLRQPIYDEDDSDSLLQIDYNHNICIFVEQDSIQKASLVDTDKFREVKIKDFECDEKLKKNVSIEELVDTNVRISASKMSLLGKTTQIQLRARAKRSQLLVLNIAGDLDPVNLQGRLTKLQNEILTCLRGSSLTLHLKVDINSKSQQEIDKLD